jgi:RNA polymerase sigma-70 factor (ECF subfamily)
LNIEADEALVRGALQGDQEACRRLVETYQRPVFTLILRMVRDPPLAEDLAQEAFLKAFRHLATFDTSRKLSSWLFKIAHNTTLDHLRRNQLDTVSLEPPAGESADHRKSWIDEDSERPDQRVESRDLAEAIEEAIGGLSPRYREIVVLRYQEGLAYQEIAQILDLPMGTVKTQIHRARGQLAQTLRDGGWAPDER